MIDELAQEQTQKREPGRMSNNSMCLDRGWRQHIATAEELYVNNPASVQALMEKVKIKELSFEEKILKVNALAHELNQKEITAVPAQVWHGSADAAKEDENEDGEPPEDRKLVNRFGFLFIAYRIDFWWWENVEMLRKLLMTSVLIFVRLCLSTEYSSFQYTIVIITFSLSLFNLSFSFIFMSVSSFLHITSVRY